MHLAAVQFDIVWENKPASHAIIEQMLFEALVPRGSFVVLPELGDTGFSFNLDAIIDDRSLEWGADLAARMGVWLQVGHATRGADGKGRNCATIISPTGSVVGTYEKVHPFGYGAKEPEFFTGGDRLLTARCDDVAVCPLVCYDLRFPELWRLPVLAADHPAELFTIGASWPAPRSAHWRALLIARAIENLAFVVGVNRVGRDPSFSYAGGSMIVSPTGEILAEAGDRPEVIQADLDLEALRAWRQDFPALRDAKNHLLGSIRTDQAAAESGR